MSVANVPLLHVRSRDGTVELERKDDVPDDFWLSLRGELGGSARQTRNKLSLPLERFLARRGAIGRLCREYRVGIDLDHRSKTLVARSNEERHLLAESLNDGHRLSQNELVGRLTGSRFKRDLRPFQERDLQVLLSLPHGANFSVPGAGKTTVSYAVYEAERQASRVRRMLVIAPLSSFDAWIEEAELSLEPAPVVHRFVDRIPLDTEVLLVNYLVEGISVKFEVHALERRDHAPVTCRNVEPIRGRLDAQPPETVRNHRQETQGLDDRRLPGVVRAYEDGQRPERDLVVLKAPEILKFDLPKHRPPGMEKLYRRLLELRDRRKLGREDLLVDG